MNSSIDVTREDGKFLKSKDEAALHQQLTALVNKAETISNLAQDEEVAGTRCENCGARGKDGAVQQEKADAAERAPLKSSSEEEKKVEGGRKKAESAIKTDVNTS